MTQNAKDNEHVHQLEGRSFMADKLNKIIIRATIDKVILTPNSAINKLNATLHGALAGLLNIGGDDTLPKVNTGC